MEKKTKTNVEIMREIRDNLSKEICDMTFEEMQEYFKKRKEAFQKHKKLAA